MMLVAVAVTLAVAAPTTPDGIVPEQDVPIKMAQTAGDGDDDQIGVREGGQPLEGEPDDEEDVHHLNDKNSEGMNKITGSPEYQSDTLEPMPGAQSDPPGTRVKAPGYTVNDAKVADSGHYYIGASRRRIGAGFGRRRAPIESPGEERAAGSALDALGSPRAPSPPVSNESPDDIIKDVGGDIGGDVPVPPPAPSADEQVHKLEHPEDAPTPTPTVSQEVADAPAPPEETPAPTIPDYQAKEPEVFQEGDTSPVPEEGVTFYKHCVSDGRYAQGYRVTIYHDTPNVGMVGMRNNDVSGIWIPHGWQVEIYDNQNYGGTVKKWDACSSENTHVSCLVNHGFNDRMESVKISPCPGYKGEAAPLSDQLTTLFQDMLGAA